MGVADEEAAFGETEELGFGGVAEGAVRGVGDLLVADAAVEGGAAVAEDLVVDLGAELLGAEEDDVEVTAAGGDIDQRVAQPALGTAGGVLVELVDEDDHFVDAEFLALGFLPDFGDDRADQEFLDVGVAAGDVDDADLLVGERFLDARQVAVGDEPVGEETAELGEESVEAVARLLDRELVVPVPVGGVEISPRSGRRSRRRASSVDRGIRCGGRRGSRR